MKYKNILEEELKNKVGVDWFKAFDTTEILGKIDFTVFPKQKNNFGRIPLLWAEAKTGDFNIIAMFVQLVLTIGKARTFDKTLPPTFLGAFDFKKIAFVSYTSIQDIFYLNDFNWNVTPSNHQTKEFLLIKQRIETTLQQNSYIYDYQKDEKELQHFIKNNLANSTTTTKIRIDVNNFILIYLRWLDIVKPIINVNWDELKGASILDSDFFLADLFVDDKDTQKLDDDLSIRDSLFVVFENEGYKIAKENIKKMFDASIPLLNKETYLHFWKRYKRPPLKEFQNYIIERRDLLVPQDIRERQGAFFTPRIWVELSQKYLTDYLGETWQEEYYVWDCAAGTGNLLAGLNNKYNLFASTLDQADINVIHERIDQGANILKSNSFQFDFLNDELLPISQGGKLPEDLFNLIVCKEKCKKLIFYINPPYAEAGNRHTIAGTGVHKDNTTNTNRTHSKYKTRIGKASNELFAQFLARIYGEMPNARIGVFCKLKNFQSPNFKSFRAFFSAKLEKVFIVPADTFDNVKGSFPIGFSIFNGEVKEHFSRAEADVYNSKGEFIGVKALHSPDASRGFINHWIKDIERSTKPDEVIGQIGVARNDMQNKSLCYIAITAGRGLNISRETLFRDVVFLTVQSSIKATWENDRDPFFYPSDFWESDLEFQSDCLAYALFDGQNRIRSIDGVNHWIPFTEFDVNSKAKFQSSFMTEFIKGFVPKNSNQIQLFTPSKTNVGFQNLQFSHEALMVFQAGKDLWRYYHAINNVNVNASLYDIREFFQGRDLNGRMLSKSNDIQYTQLIADLRRVHSVLALKLRPSIFKYGFLMG